MKRLWSILICLCLLLGSALPVFAEETAEETKHVLVIKTAEDFLAFAENCRLDSYSMGLTVSLEGDLDLKDVDFEDIPIFCGTFEGNGHTITRMNLSGEGCIYIYRQGSPIQQWLIRIFIPVPPIKNARCAASGVFNR